MHEVHSQIWPTSNTENKTKDPDAAIEESTGNATFCIITRLPQTTDPDKYTFHLRWSTHTNPSLITIPEPLLQFLCDRFGNTVFVCTEFKRDVHTFRCRPCYQSDGPVYDWMFVDFEGYKNSHPCRLAAAVVLNDAFNNTNPDSKLFQLILQSTLEQVEDISSVLLTQWTWVTHLSCHWHGQYCCTVLRDINCWWQQCSAGSTCSWCMARKFHYNVWLKVRYNCTSYVVVLFEYSRTVRWLHGTVRWRLLRHVSSRECIAPPWTCEFRSASLEMRMLVLTSTGYAYGYMVCMVVDTIQIRVRRQVGE